MSDWKQRAKQRMEAITSAAPDEIKPLPISQLVVSSVQVRREFDPVKMAELAESIRKVGVLQPILVRRVGEKLEIVSGERRWRAAQLAGLTTIPAYERELSDDDALRAAAYENLNRDGLTKYEAIKIRAQLAQRVLGTSSLDETRLMLNRLDKSKEKGEVWDTLELEFAALGETKLSTFARNQVGVFGWDAEVLEALEHGMAYPVAQTVQNAPADLRAELLDMAREGKTRSELQARIVAHSPKTLPQTKQMGKFLMSTKVDKLPPEQAEALATWLASAPGFVGVSPE